VNEKYLAIHIDSSAFVSWMERAIKELEKLGRAMRLSCYIAESPKNSAMHAAYDRRRRARRRRNRR
jgi:hypothetical protein